MFPRIIIRTPSPQGRTLLWLDVSPVIIGSSPNSDVVIALPGIAPRHFRIEILNNDRIKINKLEGKIQLNNKSIKSGFLKEGSLLQLTPTVFIEFYDAYVPINPPATYTIKFITEPLLNKQFEITSKKIIGRTRGDIIVQDKTISRQHAIIEFDKGHIFIKDKNSVNGVVINGQKIDKTDKRELFDHDIVDIGDVAFIVLCKKIEISQQNYATVEPQHAASPTELKFTIAEDPRKNMSNPPTITPKKIQNEPKKILGPDDTLYADELVMTPDELGDDNLADLVSEAQKVAQKVYTDNPSEHGNDSSSDSDKTPTPVSISEKLKQKRKKQYSDTPADINIDTKVNLDNPLEVQASNNGKGKLGSEQKIENQKQFFAKPDQDALDHEIDKLIDDLTEPE